MILKKKKEGKKKQGKTSIFTSNRTPEVSSLKMSQLEKKRQEKGQNEVKLDPLDLSTRFIYRHPRPANQQWVLGTTAGIREKDGLF